MAEMLDRDDVLSRDRNRKIARRQLRDDSADSRTKLAPSNLLNRWKGRQTKRAHALLNTGKRKARKNAPVIAASTLAVLLFLARRPILNAIEKTKKQDRMK